MAIIPVSATFGGEYKNYLSGFEIKIPVIEKNVHFNYELFA